MQRQSGSHDEKTNKSSHPNIQVQRHLIGQPVVIRRFADAGDLIPDPQALQEVAYAVFSFDERSGIALLWHIEVTDPADYGRGYATEVLEAAKEKFAVILAATRTPAGERFLRSKGFCLVKGDVTGNQPVLGWVKSGEATDEDRKDETPHG